MSFPPFLIFACLAATASAQIFADFEVSHGTTPLGVFRARLDSDKAPRTCANFIGLATGKRNWIDPASGQIRADTPFYDGLTFHRLIHNFVIQAGSPNGLGTDGPGYVIQDEFDGSLRHSGRYILSMAKSSSPNSGGSQFFITLQATPGLNDKHSVFGEVVSGREIIDSFTNPTLFPTGTADRPLTPIVINRVTISGPDATTFDIDNPALLLPRVRNTPTIPSYNSSTLGLTFDRGFQSEHLVSFSTDLESWTPFRWIRSRDSGSGYLFPLAGATGPRLFASNVWIDYSLLPNPPENLLPAGAAFSLSDRSGNTLTLTADGSGTGAWTHSNGGSGQLISLSHFDFSISSGASIHASSTASNFPLCRITATFDRPAGPAGWSELNIIASFHTPSSGWVDGAALLSALPIQVQVLQSFTVSP